MEHIAEDGEKARSAEGQSAKTAAKWVASSWTVCLTEETECKNCGEMELFSKHCPSRAPVCGNGGEMGQSFNDCPSRSRAMFCNCRRMGHREVGSVNDRIMPCRDCDEHGHSGYECLKSRDSSSLVYRNCGEKAHKIVKPLEAA